MSPLAVATESVECNLARALLPNSDSPNALVSCFRLIAVGYFAMETILPQVKNIVVVMFENRSFDNICGWLYTNSATQPSLYLPAGSPQKFDGLDPAFWNPSNQSYFSGEAPLKVPVAYGCSDYTTPNPDPEENFDEVTFQLYGPEAPSPTPKWAMQGFVAITRTRHLPRLAKSWRVIVPRKFWSFLLWHKITPYQTRGSVLYRVRPFQIAVLFTRQI